MHISICIRIHVYIYIHIYINIHTSVYYIYIYIYTDFLICMQRWRGPFARPWCRSCITLVPTCNTHFITLQHTATHCFTLHMNIYRNFAMLARSWCRSSITPVPTCNTLPHTVSHCNTLHIYIFTYIGDLEYLRDHGGEAA